MQFVTEEEERMANSIVNFCLKTKRVTLDELKGAGRAGNKVKVRQGAAYLLKTHIGLHEKLMFNFLGEYNRSTFWHSIKAVTESIEQSYDKTFLWVKKYNPHYDSAANEEEYLLEIMN